MRLRLGGLYLLAGDKKSAMDEYAAFKRIAPELADTLLKEIKQ
jgi:hypothetical protein